MGWRIREELALKFKLPDGTDTDLVTHSFNGFPSPTADDFRQFLIALGTSGPSVGHPTPADTYLAAHPLAKTFLETQKLPPVSYGTLSYYGVQHDEIHQRSRASPARQAAIASFQLAGEQYSDRRAGRCRRRPAYLVEEVRQRVARAPGVLAMLVQLAAGRPGKLEDPSIA